MRRVLRFPKWAARSERRTSKPQRNTFGLSPYHRRLACEALEDRRLLSVLTVANANDSGAGSLRATILAAVAGDTIQFASSLNGQTITLTSGELDITKSINIGGPGANQLTIKASNSYSGPVFDVASTATASILGVTITKGYNEAVYNAGNLSLTNCTISYVTGGTSLYGINFDGHWGGSLVVNGCSIQNNGDAGIHFDGSGGGALTVTNSNLSGNYQGLNIGAGTSTITSCTISGNSNDGVYFQGYMGNPGVMTITNTTISGNSLSGIDDWGATLTINDSTIADNGQNASFGGGIYDDGGTLVANDCTIARNSASGGGGGIYQESGTTSTLNNTIVAGNMNGTSPDIYRAVTANHCLIGDNTGSGLAAAPVGTPDANGNMIGTHTSPIDPMLVRLANYGGPTNTMPFLAGSPAIDTGSNALAQAAGLVNDQRGAGYSRIQPAGGTVDIGACEGPVATPIPVIHTVTNANDSGAGSLRQAILDANASDTIQFAEPVGPDDNSDEW